MFRLRALYPSRLRVFYSGAVGKDELVTELLNCTGEDHVFSLVSKNKAEYTVYHVSCAMRMLWKFQKEKTDKQRKFDQIKSRPEFLTLRFLAENKASLMSDGSLLEILYSVLRLEVEHHDSLVQQLTTEGWNRLESFSMPRLARFSERLSEQGLDNSPLMGQIAEIVNQKLDSIEEINVLTTLMICISNLASPRLCDALIEKADVLLDTMDPVYYNSLIQILRFLRSLHYVHHPLVEKCNHMLLQNVPHMEAGDISNLFAQLGKSRNYRHSDFMLGAKQRLIELMETSNVSFIGLTVYWGPSIEQATREKLERTALLIADELNCQQALVVVDTLCNIQSWNFQLIDKYASIIQKNLDVFPTFQIVKLTQQLMSLHYENPELISRLKNRLLFSLHHSVSPKEVSILTHTLSMLPSPCMDEVAISRIDAMLHQCSLSNLHAFTLSIGKWIRSDPTYCYNTPSKFVRLLQTLNRCGRERLQKTDQLDLMLQEIRSISGKWFEETLLEDTIAMIQRLINQVSQSNLPELAHFLARRNIRCTPVLDRIASVALENIHKIHYLAFEQILSPFAFLNYYSPTVDELFDVCIQRFTPHISSIDCFMLVNMAHTLAVANSFPEEVIREIFSVDFLAKLESKLKSQSDFFNKIFGMKLMVLNRAVCLECPQYQVPWIHERFCKQLQKEDSFLASPIQKQIHKMMGEVLGGMNYVREAVLTPYFYTVDFECVLDHRNQAVPYSKLSQLQMTKNRNVHWDSGSADEERKELLPGSRRIAIDFLDSESYCNRSHHVKGEVLMRKRHLEILGYQVIQIPHFEWNSMELSNNDDWKEYLRKKLFTEQA
ncbi:FAST kinase domain-containing protein 1, mitochondrial [Astyanax mexicanus]|uniref:FAST kinase domain-containing protein 1, mitochondrial n=1 Tax=Astyanax mexicanus TaxID=7994 RepID=A0A8B9LZW8_ASTMX|nr:FAST kinase domain-containing protein 1, mitochondrial [Astyanax mexicanus]